MNSFWPNFKENWLMALLVSLVFLALVIFLGVQISNGIKTGDTIGRVAVTRDTITIEGDGKVTGKPDVALIDLGLLNEGPQVVMAQSINTKQVNDIIAAMKGLGIVADDIQTSNYSISPKYNYLNGQSTIIGYTVSQTVSVKVRDLTKIGAVLSGAGALGLNQVNGLQFKIDDPTSLKAQARTKAISDAKSKAEELAKELGLSVHGVIGFSESSGNVPQPMYMKETALGMGGAPAAAPDIQSGSLDVLSHVSVTFEIR
jgi:uncharacterized protein YggE